MATAIKRGLSGVLRPFFRDCGAPLRDEILPLLGLLWTLLRFADQGLQVLSTQVRVGYRHSDVRVPHGLLNQDGASTFSEPCRDAAMAKVVLGEARRQFGPCDSVIERSTERTDTPASVPAAVGNRDRRPTTNAVPRTSAAGTWRSDRPGLGVVAR